jgi:hypothetical protein
MSAHMCGLCTEPCCVLLLLFVQLDCLHIWQSYTSYCRCMNTTRIHLLSTVIHFTDISFSCKFIIEVSRDMSWKSFFSELRNRNLYSKSKRQEPWLWHVDQNEEIRVNVSILSLVCLIKTNFEIPITRFIEIRNLGLR